MRVILNTLIGRCVAGLLMLCHGLSICICTVNTFAHFNVHKTSIIQIFDETELSTTNDPSAAVRLVALGVERKSTIALFIAGLIGLGIGGGYVFQVGRDATENAKKYRSSSNDTERDFLSVIFCSITIAAAIICSILATVDLRLSHGIGEPQMSDATCYGGRTCSLPTYGLVGSGERWTIESWTCQVASRFGGQGELGDVEKICHLTTAARWLMVPLAVSCGAFTLAGLRPYLFNHIFERRRGWTMVPTNL